MKAPKSARITRVKTNTGAATVQRVIVLDSALLVAEEWLKRVSAAPPLDTGGVCD
jgi:hypothetical protein